MGCSDESVVLWQAGSRSVVKATQPASVLAEHPQSQATPDREKEGAEGSDDEDADQGICRIIGTRQTCVGEAGQERPRYAEILMPRLCQAQVGSRGWR